MSFEQILAFFIFGVVAAITPGPSNAMVMIAGARSGFLGGLRCLFGVVSGMALLIGSASLGWSEIIDAHPSSLSALKWLGSAFLLWMAWKVATAPPMKGEAQGDVLGFWRAFAFQWVNPKSWIVGMGAAGAYGSAANEGVVAVSLTMALVFAAAAAPSCAAWLAFGATLQHWLTDERRSRVFNVTMGVALGLTVLLI